MNTIMISEKDFKEKLINYKGEKYFENFIFNEFRIIMKHDDYKVIYKVHIENNVIEVKYRIIQNCSYNDCKLKFAECEEGWKFIEKPNGELIDKYIQNMVNKYGDSISDERIIQTLTDWMNAEVGFIVRLKQYIMNESYKRTIIQKVSCKTSMTKNENTKKGNRARKPVVQFLLGDIIEYVNSNRREFNITCECWNVRGHFRHYKNGKVSWIPSYEKGKKRNTNSSVIEHIYNI